MSQINAEGTTTYQWDSRNRLKSLVLPNDQTITFLYDFAGNLIQQSTIGSASTVTRNFIVDELTNVVHESNSKGEQFSILTGQRIDDHFAVIVTDNQVTFGVTDAINSTTATVDQIGALSTQFFYEPFGQTTSSGKNYPNTPSCILVEYQ